MYKEDLGQYFIKNGEIYEAISYIDNPALELKNLSTGEKEVVVIGSMVSHEYSKLYSIECSGDVYNYDSAIPVKDIKL